MKQKRASIILSRIYLFFSAASLLMVSLMAFSNPQSVMDLVQVKLPNNDAFSSIRGVYGGVGLTISLSLAWWALKDIRQGIVFATVLWGLYAVSRLMTMSVEGPLGAFGKQWLMIESVLCILGIALLAASRGVKPEPQS
ncbi:DUF4345 domain-containing protein [Chitinophaga qingshengii]|uniref:DUF4345 domain-containing protein n=1 Tax=Chitinophaga qingshengii TaxID=1569794 RepID=A0ABR7TSN5_9BACT|nr:DUF4345 domain-containing protein [Chitinophaga qingshengii]MBC9931989.1 DUF4345 domain-containing protein [Chitinophaga qingshengii]